MWIGARRVPCDRLQQARGSGKGRRICLALPMLGRDDLLLSAYPNWFAIPSDIDASTWRNRTPLRVRLTEENSSQSAGGCFPPCPCPTKPALGRGGHFRQVPRLCARQAERGLIYTGG